LKRKKEKKMEKKGGKGLTESWSTELSLWEYRVQQATKELKKREGKMV